MFTDNKRKRGAGRGRGRGRGSARGGSSAKSRDSKSLLEDAAKKRAERQKDREKTEKAGTAQRVWRSYHARKLLRISLRQGWDESIAQEKDGHLSTLVFLYNPDEDAQDDCRLALMCLHLLRKEMQLQLTLSCTLQLQLSLFLRQCFCCLSRCGLHTLDFKQQKDVERVISLFSSRSSTDNGFNAVSLQASLEIVHRPLFMVLQGKGAFTLFREICIAQLDDGTSQPSELQDVLCPFVASVIVLDDEPMDESALPLLCGKAFCECILSIPAAPRTSVFAHMIHCIQPDEFLGAEKSQLEDEAVKSFRRWTGLLHTVKSVMDDIVEPSKSLAVGANIVQIFCTLVAKFCACTAAASESDLSGLLCFLHIMENTTRQLPVLTAPSTSASKSENESMVSCSKRALENISSEGLVRGLFKFLLRVGSSANEDAKSIAEDAIIAASALYCGLVQKFGRTATTLTRCVNWTQLPHVHVDIDVEIVMEIGT
jgi:hypothetical protein